MVNVEPDPDWILRPDVLNGLQVLAARRLTFDYVGILPRHLEHVPLIAQRVPDLRIVIDHLGKPPIAAGDLEPWGSLLARAAQMPNVFVAKVRYGARPISYWPASHARNVIASSVAQPSNSIVCRSRILRRERPLFIKELMKTLFEAREQN